MGRRKKMEEEGGRDPLAQTFNINDETGVFLTKIDLFFQQKDDQFPVKFQINETEARTPTQQFFHLVKYIRIQMKYSFLMMLLFQLLLNSNLQFIWNLKRIMH